MTLVSCPNSSEVIGIHQNKVAPRICPSVVTILGALSLVSCMTLNSLYTVSCRTMIQVFFRYNLYFTIFSVHRIVKPQLVSLIINL
jgi:hypothetical protein